MTPYVVSFFLFFGGLMKKIFVACSKWCYRYVPDIAKRLEQLGYQVILPNCFDDPFIEEKIKTDMTKEEHVEFCRNSFLESMEKVKLSDAILVVNIDKEKDGVIYPNYIGGATFLEMYDSYLLNHPIFLYNDIPNNMLYDEIEGMNPVVLNKNLFDIIDYDDFANISEDNHLLNYFQEDDLVMIKECDDLYLKAAVIVKRLFCDKKDKAGNPYIGHLQRVSDRLEGITKVAGLLHDTVEDTDVTFKDLFEVGFTKDILVIDYLVTKLEFDKTGLTEEDKLKLYDEEINGVINSGNYGASLLKEADMTDNYDPERLALLPDEKQDWFYKKYGKQLVKLKKVNKERNQSLC